MKSMRKAQSCKAACITPVQTVPRVTTLSCQPGVRVGRNDPCPCGSGEKFKNCHGKLN